MKHLEKLNTLKTNYKSGIITKADFTQDLIFLKEDIQNNLVDLESLENEKLHPFTFNLNDFDVIKTSEFHTATSLSTTEIKSIRSILQSAFYEGRYGLVFNVTQNIINSDFQSSYKRSIKDLYYSVVSLTGIDKIRVDKKELLKSKIVLESYIKFSISNTINWFSEAEKSELYFSRAFSITNPIKEINIIEKFESDLSLDI